MALKRLWEASVILILDVAVTGIGIDGQSRTSDDAPDRPLRNVRYEQKMTKYHIEERTKILGADHTMNMKSCRIVKN